MRVKVDPTLCQGHAQCVIFAPEVFTLDEAQNIAIVLQEHPAEALRENVETAVRSCPVCAISLTED